MEWNGISRIIFFFFFFCTKIHSVVTFSIVVQNYIHFKYANLGIRRFNLLNIHNLYLKDFHKKINMFKCVQCLMMAIILVRHKNLFDCAKVVTSRQTQFIIIIIIWECTSVSRKLTTP